MSVIAVLTSGETGANSLVDINDNFSSLNTDKLEKGTATPGNVAAFGATDVMEDTGLVAPTGAFVGTSDSQTLTNKTLTAPVIGSIVNTGTLTLPTSTDTLVGRATTDTLTNKTITTPTITKPVMSATNPTAQTYTPAGGGTSTLDLSLSNQHYVTFPAGNITLALSNDTNNQVFYVTLTQDSVGSRTVSWFSTIKWSGGTTPTLTTTANKRDAFIFVRTGSATYDGFVVGLNI